MPAVRVFHENILPIVNVSWVDEGAHERSLIALLAANRCRVSLVDWTYFDIMRQLAIQCAFTFDDDFDTYGFTVVPELEQSPTT